MASEHARWPVVLGVLLSFLLPAGYAVAQGVQRVGPRDQLNITVFGEERMSGRFPVDGDGQLAYPFIGLIKVAGSTPREIEALIARRLKDEGIFTVPPQIAVELAQQSPNKKVTVTGAIRSPGEIRYAGELTILAAIVQAGSPTSDAGDEVLIVRAPETEAAGADAEALQIRVNLSELNSGNLAEHNVALRDGDLVIVQKAQSVVITGAVRSPGAYRVEPGTTLLRAVALAGDLSERGTMRGVRIIRAGKEVKDIKQDTVVQPGDTIVVKTSPF